MGNFQKDMDLESFRLAEDNEAVKISSRQDNYDALLSMLKQAQQSLDIFSHNLDGALYNTDEYLTALKQLSLSSKKAKIRILLRDSNHVLKHGHRFIELSRRLSSFIEIRQVNSEYEHTITCYSIVDNRGIIYRNDALRYEAKVNYNDPMLARDLLKQFNEMWNHSDPSLEMRRLHI